MKVYQLYREDKVAYKEKSGMVVVADSLAEAIRIAKDNTIGKSKWNGEQVWTMGVPRVITETYRLS